MKVSLLAFFLIISLCAFSQELIFHFPFNGNLNDSTSNQFILEPSKADAVFGSGQFGSAVILDGSENQLDLNNEGLNNPAETAFTVCAWVNSQATVGVDASEQIILAQKNGPNDNKGRLQMFLRMNSQRQGLASYVGNKESSGNTNNFPLNSWKHIAVIGDPMDSSLTFYIDGVLDGQVTSGSFESTTGGFRVGAHKSAARFFNGAIDELYFFKGKLTTEQLLQVRDNAWTDRVSTALLNSIIKEINLFLASITIGNNPGEYAQETINVLNDSLSVAQTLLTSNPTFDEVVAITSNLQAAFIQAKDNINKAPASISISTAGGHEINEGLGGYNMRIGDSPWTYKNPVFKEGVKAANPGFLRYFSGTRNDYLDMNTGYYEFQHFEQVNSDLQGGIDADGSKDGWPGQAPNDLKWVNGKPANRIFDLYELCGEVGAKLLVTLNSFVQSPEEVKTFVKFIKNNNIIVEAYQFTNEPNFYIPNRRYFYNNGKDFAHKMKEIADAVYEIDPEAKIAHNYGWDGLGNWAQGIKTYEQEQGRYWDFVSFHSYAIHGGENPDPEIEIRRANSRLVDRTNEAFFNNKVSPVSWNNSKIILTEYGVWNATIPSRSAYGGIYTSEYAARMSLNPRAHLIGNHHIGEGIYAGINYRDAIWNGFNNQIAFDPTSQPNSFISRPDKYSLNIAFGVINNSKRVWDHTLTGSEMVATNNATIPALFVGAYEGMDSVDYLLVINKSAIQHQVSIDVDGVGLSGEVMMEYTWAEQAFQDPVQVSKSVMAGDIEIAPYSVTMLAWNKVNEPVPVTPRIYQVKHDNGGATVKWWERPIADEYVLKYGTTPSALTNEIIVTEPSASVTGLAPDMTYYFAVSARNGAGSSPLSNIVTTQVSVPQTPTIVRTIGDDQRATLHWESVPHANGYLVKYGTSSANLDQIEDAKNSPGVVIRQLTNDQSYYFQVVAYNGNGESVPSSITEVKVSDSIPWAPYLVKAEQVATGGNVNISWVASDFNRNATFNVYYCPTPWDSTQYQLLASDITETTYLDTETRPVGSHYYRVTAENGSGESHFFSNISTAEVTFQRIAVDSINLRTLNNLPDSVEVGSTLLLEAIVNPTNATTRTVTWSSSDETIATVSNSGLVSGLSSGSVTITATAEDGSFVSGDLSVKVYNPPILVSEIQISGNTEMNVGETQMLSVSINPASATDTTLSWSSSDESVASVSPEGLVSALAQGPVTISASANDESGISGDFMLNVSVLLGVENISTQVYPNPTDDSLTVLLKKEARVDLIDLSGKTILKKNIAGRQSHSISLKNLNSGTYLLKISYNDATTETIQIIKR